MCMVKVLTNVSKGINKHALLWFQVTLYEHILIKCKTGRVLTEYLYQDYTNACDQCRLLKKTHVTVLQMKISSITSVLTHLHSRSAIWCAVYRQWISQCILYNQLTYLLTPWSRVLLEKLSGSAASQEIPRIFGTRRFITVLTSARHLSLS